MIVLIKETYTEHGHAEVTDFLLFCQDDTQSVLYYTINNNKLYNFKCRIMLTKEHAHSAFDQKKKK